MDREVNRFAGANVNLPGIMRRNHTGSYRVIPPTAFVAEYTSLGEKSAVAVASLADLVGTRLGVSW